MNRKEIYALVAVVVLAIVGHAYITSVRDTTAAETVKKVTQQQIEQLRADLATELAKIQQDKKETQTPQQVVVKLPQYIPNLPEQPIVIKPNDPHPELPDAPGIFFPQASVKPLFDFTAECKSCGLKLTECEKEKVLLTQRAETAEKAMKGGGFFTRIKRNAKWFAIGAAAGAAAGYAAKR